MNRLHTRPEFWLVAASVLVCAGTLLRSPVAEIAPDSREYLEFEWSSLQGVLSSPRTVGYPLFLQFCRLLGRPERVAPLLQVGALIAAVWVFFAGLCKAGFRTSVAACCAGALLLGRAGHEWGSALLADSLAISLSLAAVGSFLATTSRAPGLWAWVGLTVCTMGAYHTRPAQLFLLPLWPALGWLLDRYLLRREVAFAARWRRVGWYCVVAGVPFLAFCTLRAAAVGHWGLVSFGGYNIVGVAGQFLEEDMVPRLSSDLQPLARDILDRRAALAAEYPRPDVVNIQTYEERFNPVVWRCAVPAARARYKADPAQVNRALSRLSREILTLRPFQYAHWLRCNALHALKQTILLTATDYGTLFAGLIGFAALAWQLIAQRLPATGTADSQRFLERHLLFWTATAFAAASSLLVVLVEPAIARYITAAMGLLPAVVMSWAFHLLIDTAAADRSSRDTSP